VVSLEPELVPASVVPLLFPLLLPCAVDELVPELVEGALVVELPVVPAELPPELLVVDAAAVVALVDDEERSELPLEVELPPEELEGVPVLPPLLEPGSAATHSCLVQVRPPLQIWS
jgi:hypothetical protein